MQNFPIGNSRCDLSLTGVRIMDKKDIPQPKPEQVVDDLEEEEIDLDYIIDEKPKPKVVREFMKAQLETIKSEEDLLFAK